MATAAGSSAESEALTIAFRYLVDSIDSTSVLPAALSAHLISESQRSECASEAAPFKRAEKFLGHLQRAVNGDSNKYHTFIQVLMETGQASIASRLQEELTNTCTPRLVPPAAEVRKQFVVSDEVLDNLVDLRVKYARLLCEYKNVLERSLEARKEFVDTLPRLLGRSLGPDHSFQSYFDKLVDEEVSLFNITYLEKLCRIFPDDVRTATKKLVDSYKQHCQDFMAKKTVNQFKALFPASATPFKLLAEKVSFELRFVNVWGDRTLSDLKILVGRFGVPREHLHLYKIDDGCIAVIWLCSTLFIKELKAAIVEATDLLETEGVLKVFIEEELVLECSKPDQDLVYPTLMQYLIELRSDWFLLGIALKVPISNLREIEVSHPHDGPKQWMPKMLQYWLDTTPIACLKQVATALEQIDMITLASNIRKTYHLDSALSVPLLWPSTVDPTSLMQHLSEIRSDVWVFFGIALGVPLNVIKSIQSYYPDARVQQWMTELIWYWLMETPYITAIDSWKKVVAALEQVDMLTLASKIKQKYLWKPEESAEAEIEADGNTVRLLRDLVFAYSMMLTAFRDQDQVKSCDVIHAKSFLTHLLSSDFTNCDTSEKIINQLCNKHVDIFQLFYLRAFADHLKCESLKKLVDEYEKKKKHFLEKTTILDFQKAIVAKTTPRLPNGMVEVTIRIPKQLANKRILIDIERLALEAFEEKYHRFVSFHAKAGSIISWYVDESLCKELQQMAQRKTALWTQHEVKEVVIGSQCVFLFKRYIAQFCTKVKTSVQEISGKCDTVLDLANTKHTPIVHEKTAAMKEIDQIEGEQAAQNRESCYRHAVEEAREYNEGFSKLANSAKNPTTMTTIERELQCKPPNLKPLAKYFSGLEQSFETVKQCYSKFKKSCDDAIAAADRAATANKEKATTFRQRDAAVAGAGLGVAASVVAGAFTFGLGTIIGLYATAAAGAVGGAVVGAVLSANDYERLAVKFDQLKALYISLRKTTSTMQDELSHFDFFLETIRQLLAQ